MPRKPKRIVFIDNPRDGGRKKTVFKSALDFVARGWAEWSGPNRIRFVERVQRDVYFAKQIDRTIDQHIKANRHSAFVWWNGVDTRHDATHGPGESQVIERAVESIPFHNFSISTVKKCLPVRPPIVIEHGKVDKHPV